MNEQFFRGDTFTEFLGSVVSFRELWHQVYQRAELPDEAVSAAEGIDGNWRFLVLAEDWCGDAVHIVPFLARLQETFPQFDLRILSRDENPEIMDSHLTNGTRSIPVVMVLDEDFEEVGWWGPRPTPLQGLFLKEIKPLPKEERFPKVRAWLARDRGRTTMKEILELIPVRV